MHAIFFFGCSIGGLEAFEQDISIPLNYGIDQCVGDTLSAGGIMYGQRGIQEMLSICKDIREVAEPNCLLLNHANPMAMLTWVCQTYGEVNTVASVTACKVAIDKLQLFLD